MTEPNTPGMADDTAAVGAPTESQRRGSGNRRNRARTALAAVLALLVLLLIVLTVFVLQLLIPAGAPDNKDLAGGYSWVRSIYGWGKQESQQLYGPTDVAIGRDGTIWATDPQRWQVVAFNPDGSYKTILHRGPLYMAPQTIATGPDGNIYVADGYKNKIRVFSPDTTELRSFDTSLPSEIAVADDGRIAVGMPGAIAIYSGDGKLINFWGNRGKSAEDVDVIRGIAWGPDGNIYVSDAQNHRIKSYTPEGELRWVNPTPEQQEKWAEEKKAGRSVRKPFQLPQSMVFDGSGRLVLVDAFDFRIVIVDPKTGKTSETYGDYGVKDGKFAYPSGIDFDPARDWFAIADTANNRVQIVRLPGSGGSLFSGLARAATGPIWVCFIPLILLLIALAIAISRRRKREQARRAAIAAADVPDGGPPA